MPLCPNARSKAIGGTYKSYNILYYPSVQPPHGPHKIATNGQVVLPKDILAITGLRPGDAVYVQALEAPEGAVLIVPAATAAEWFEAGRQRSRGDVAGSP